MNLNNYNLFFFSEKLNSLINKLEIKYDQSFKDQTTEDVL